MDDLFIPSPDVTSLLQALLDRHERRLVAALGEGAGNQRSICLKLAELSLPGYFNQADPEPRIIANQQLQRLEQAGLLRLGWLPGESGHLLEGVTLLAECAPAIFRLLERTPAAACRARLAELLLSERFRFESATDWRRRALERILAQVKAGKSPAPFSLTDQAFNQDILAAMAALDDVQAETPCRVFSVRVFNDSKRFEALRNALARLARFGCPEWRRLPVEEVLRELNLVPNPSYIYLSGPWQLTAGSGEILSLGGFTPAVGISAAQAAQLHKATSLAQRVVCIENATPFYEFVRNTCDNTATLCLSGNPGPACRRLLSLLAGFLPEEIPLLVWADLDYGGLNILSQLRRRVSPRFLPYRMDIQTLEEHVRWARPLAAGDAQNLKRLALRRELADMRPLIGHLLERGLKLEQEAVLV